MWRRQYRLPPLFHNMWADNTDCHPCSTTCGQTIQTATPVPQHVGRQYRLPHLFHNMWADNTDCHTCSTTCGQTIQTATPVPQHIISSHMHIHTHVHIHPPPPAPHPAPIDTVIDRDPPTDATQSIDKASPTAHTSRPPPPLPNHRHSYRLGPAL